MNMWGPRVPHTRGGPHIYTYICDIYIYLPLLKGGLGLVTTPQNVTNM